MSVKNPISKEIKKCKSMLIIGRKWFDKVNGNTYHTTEIQLNGEFFCKSSFTYGYGDHWKQTALELLQDKGLVSLPRPLPIVKKGKSIPQERRNKYYADKETIRKIWNDYAYEHRDKIIWVCENSLTKKGL